MSKTPERFVIGHRGSPVAAVENTIPSCALAVREGANAVEIDLCFTRDRQVVVFHDWDPSSAVAILRQQGLEGDVGHKPVVPSLGSAMRRPVHELTLTELRANYTYARKVGGTTASAVIPTLSEFVTWARGASGLRAIVFDLKVEPRHGEAIATDFLREVVRGSKGLPRTCLAWFLSPYLEVLLWLKFVDIRVRHGLDMEFDSPRHAVEDAVNYMTRVVGIGGRVMKLFPAHRLHERLRAELEALAKAQRTVPKPVIEHFVTWTINDPLEGASLFALGVHGVITDRPRDLAQALKGDLRQLLVDRPKPAKRRLQQRSGRKDPRP